MREQVTLLSLCVLIAAGCAGLQPPEEDYQASQLDQIRHTPLNLISHSCERV